MNAIAAKLERLTRDAMSEDDHKFGLQVLDPHKSLVGEYGLNSVGLIKLVMAIEGAFEVQIRDEDLNFDNFDSLQTIRALLERQYLIGTSANS